MNEFLDDLLVELLQEEEAEGEEEDQEREKGRYLTTIVLDLDFISWVFQLAEMVI